MDLADVTVVLPTKNERTGIAHFLRGIPGIVPLIVVDASDDGTVELIERLREGNVTCIRDHGAIAAARQLGAEAASTSWLLFSDADVAFDSSYFERLAAIEPPARCGGIVGAKCSLGRYKTYYRLFSLWLLLICRLGIPAASGSNMLVRRTALFDAGGFDTRLACNEDSMLMWNVRRCGYEVQYRKELRVYETDHGRLDNGLFIKTAHSIVRCIALFTGMIKGESLSNDWGYWKRGRKKAGARNNYPEGRLTYY